MEERRSQDRLEGELKLSAQFEVAWAERRRVIARVGPWHTEDQLTAYKREFKAGWFAAYQNVHAEMRRDIAGVAR